MVRYEQPNLSVVFCGNRDGALDIPSYSTDPTRIRAISAWEAESRVGTELQNHGIDWLGE